MRVFGQMANMYANTLTGWLAAQWLANGHRTQNGKSKLVQVDFVWLTATIGMVCMRARRASERLGNCAWMKNALKRK